MILGGIAVALGVAVASALTAAPRLAPRRPGRWGVLAAVGVVGLLAPLAVPAGSRIARLLTAVAAITIAVKLYDVTLDGGRSLRPGPWGFLAFLANIFALVLRKQDAGPRPSRRADATRLVRGAVALVVGAAVFVAVFQLPWRRLPLAAEHATKVLALAGVLIPAVAVGSAGWRLLGGSALDFMDRPLAARTPADFWRRYNRPVQQFFFEDVFKPAGGLRSPIRATFLVFAVSGAVHEYIFTVAIGRVRGYQVAFFLLEGAAVAATLRVRPRGWRTAPWVAGTLAFNLAASALFFASLGEVVPFYAARPAPPGSRRVGETHQRFDTDGGFHPPYRARGPVRDRRSGDDAQGDVRDHVEQEDAELVEHDPGERHRVVGLGGEADPAAVGPMQPSARQHEHQPPHREQGEVDDRAPQEHAAQRINAHDITH